MDTIAHWEPARRRVWRNRNLRRFAQKSGFIPWFHQALSRIWSGQMGEHGKSVQFGKIYHKDSSRPWRFIPNSWPLRNSGEVTRFPWDFLRYFETNPSVDRMTQRWRFSKSTASIGCGLPLVVDDWFGDCNYARSKGIIMTIIIIMGNPMSLWTSTNARRMSNFGFWTLLPWTCAS